jgi:hypothetical protein
MWLQVLKGIDMQEALEGSMAYAERAHLYSADEQFLCNLTKDYLSSFFVLNLFGYSSILQTVKPVLQKGLIYILQMNLRRLMKNWLHSLKNG